MIDVYCITYMHIRMWIEKNKGNPLINVAQRLYTFLIKQFNSVELE